MQDLYFACASDSAYTAYTCIWSVCVYAVYFTFVSDFVSVCVEPMYTFIYNPSCMDLHVYAPAPAHVHAGEVHVRV